MRYILRILIIFVTLFNNTLLSLSYQIDFMTKEEFDAKMVEILDRAEEIEELKLYRPLTLGPLETEFDISILSNFTNLKSIEFLTNNSPLYSTWHSLFNEKSIQSFPILLSLEKIKISKGIKKDFVKQLLEWLTNFENLKEIDLSHNVDMIGDMVNKERYGFEVLNQLHNLNVLNLSFSTHFMRGSCSLEGLEEVKNLKTLILGDNFWGGHYTLHSGQTDEAFILSLDYLEEVDLSYRKFPYKQDLKKYFSIILPNLKKLNLQGSEIVNLDWAAYVPNLESLTITEMDFENFDLRDLGNFRNLKKLAISHNFTKDNLWEIQSIEPLEDLEDLYFSGNIKTLDFCFAPNLKVLSLNSSNVSNGDLKSISLLKNLESLDLSYTGVTGPGLKKLEKLTQLKTLSLADLDLSKVNFENFINLEFLNLQNSELNLDGFSSLRNLYNLKVLDLRRIKSKHISEEDILELAEALGCEIYYYKGMLSE